MPTPPPAPVESAASKFAAAREKAKDADLDAIGAHCDLDSCHQLDFLPFTCEKCKGKFCLDHRQPSSHLCPALVPDTDPRFAPPPASTTSTANRPKPVTSSSANAPKCASSTCTTKINTSLSPAIKCTTCQQNYCLKHRLSSQHKCEPPVSKIVGAQAAGKDKLKEALGRFKLWAASSSSSSKSSGSSSGGSSSSSSSARRAQATTDLITLKRTAKGDASVPLPQRVYLAVQGASATALKSGNFYFAKTWKVGKVLDKCCEGLGVENKNNVNESERLRIYWVEGGRLLEFREEIGVVGTKAEIVLLRGVE